MSDYTTEELITCALARELRDGERGFLGANAGVGRRAQLLAQRMHAPNLRLLLGFAWVGEAPRGLHDDSTDHRDAAGAEGWMELDSMISSYRFFSDICFLGALQIDRFGNSNLIGIGDDHRRLRFRGPGPMGSVSSTAFADRFYLVPSRHTREVFVERCDFVSTPGGNAALCVTPRCVFDFDDGHALRLKSVHPGHTVDEVLKHTAFEVEVPANVGETAPPTDEELRLLRS